MKTGGTGTGCMGCLSQIVGLFIVLILLGGCVGLFVGEDEEDNTEDNTEDTVSENTENTYTGEKGKERVEDEEETITEEVEEVSETGVEEVSETESKEEVEKPVSYEVKEEEVSNTGNGISVVLDRVVDGDTVNVYLNGESIGLRLLLIDTPETVHPKKPVEKYGVEASNRVKELVSNSNLTIEYDTGDTTDHYGRHLVYLYADGVSVQETLISEGLARVGYVYEQVRYLDYYNSLQSVAKQNQLGIWSIPNYVNETGEGFNSGTESNTQSNTGSSTGSSVEPSVNNEGKTYKNCEELKKDFPDGVSSDHPSYKASGDRDNDGWYCES